MYGTPYQFLAIAAAELGDNTLIAAPAANQRIVVTAIVFTVAGAAELTLKSGSNELAQLGGFADEGQAAGLALSHSPSGYFECAPGQALVLNLSAASTVRGFLNYMLR